MLNLQILFRVLYEMQIGTRRSIMSFFFILKKILYVIIRYHIIQLCFQHNHLIICYKLMLFKIDKIREQF